MNAYWMLFILFLIVGGFGSGMYTEHKFDLVKQLEHTQAVDAKNVALESTANTGLSKADTEIQSLQLEPPPVIDDAKTDCTLSPGSVQLLRRR